MRIILESAAYLIIMALICLLSIDFIAMNMEISEVNEAEQYIEDYIEIYGVLQDNNMLDEQTINAVKEYAAGKGMAFQYEYINQTQRYDYYRIHITYALHSRIFKLRKSHTYDGLIRLERSDAACNEIEAWKRNRMICV